MSKGADFPVEFHRLPMKLRAMQWTGDNEGAIQTELTGDGAFHEIEYCEPDCPCDKPAEITAEVLNSFGTYWQGMETGWWVCMNESGQLFPLSPEMLVANYVEGA